jgi:uncharacterized membrane protein YedE/YeeE
MGLAMPREKSFTLVLVASLVIAIVIPFVRALTRGDDAAAAAAHVVLHPHAPQAVVIGGRDGSDELSMLAVGAFLLGLGVVLRRAA